MASVDLDQGIHFEAGLRNGEDNFNNEYDVSMLS
jgi:hypothetical protein